LGAARESGRTRRRGYQRNDIVDRTNYFEQVPSNQLDLALWLEADRMGTLTGNAYQGKARQSARSREKRAAPELRQPAYGSWLEKALTYVYPASHPYHHSVIGSMTDLTNASVSDVTSFFKTYYARTTLFSSSRATSI